MKTVSEIISSNKCIACGMCQSVCPEKAITLKPDEKSGFWQAEISGKCVSCGLCFSSCPAAQDCTVAKDTLGAHKKIVLCRSTNSEVRKNATSGGAVNSVIRFLIESGKAQSVIAVKENQNAPFESEAAVINKSNLSLLTESPRSFASRYVGVPVLSALKLAEGKTAVIGTPCQIKALSKRDRRNEYIKIGIACSGATSYNASRIIKNRLANESFQMYYRGNGWPGFNTLTDGSTTVETAHGKSYFGAMFTSQLFRRYGCRFCPSHFAEESDLTFFDFWDDEEMKTEKLGNSVCVVRSELGQELYQGSITSGYLEEVRALDEAEAVATQCIPLKYKSKRPYSSLYFRLADIIQKLRLYRFLPLKSYKYFCRLLAKFTG